MHIKYRIAPKEKHVTQLEEQKEMGNPHQELVASIILRSSDTML